MRNDLIACGVVLIVIGIVFITLFDVVWTLFYGNRGGADGLSASQTLGIAILAVGIIIFIAGFALPWGRKVVTQPTVVTCSPTSSTTTVKDSFGSSCG